MGTEQAGKAGGVWSKGGTNNNQLVGYAEDAYLSLFGLPPLRLVLYLWSLNN